MVALLLAPVVLQSDYPQPTPAFLFYFKRLFIYLKYCNRLLVSATHQPPARAARPPESGGGGLVIQAVITATLSGGSVFLCSRLVVGRGAGGRRVVLPPAAGGCCVPPGEVSSPVARGGWQRWRGTISS